MIKKFRVAAIFISASLSISGCGGGSGSSADEPVIFNLNNPPSISGTPQTNVIVDTAYSFRPVASDPEGDPLTFSVQNRPGWANFDSMTGTLSGMPRDADVGSYNNIMITTSDGISSSSLSMFAVEVMPRAATNAAPVISGTAITALTVGTSYSFTPTASDPDGDPLSFSISNRPAWASFDSATGTLSGIAQASNVGVYGNISITVNDGELSASLAPFSITVNPNTTSNTPPTISGVPITTATANTSFSFTPVATDADGDSLSFGIQNPPSWAFFNPATGTLFGIPTAGDEGVYTNIIISVTDGTSFASLPTFSLTVQAGPGSNNPPAISGKPDLLATVGDSYSFVPTATDPDGDSLTFSIENLPSWASFDSVSGTLVGSPQSSDVGTYGGISIIVSDGEQSALLPPFAITVSDTNTAPTISGSPSTSVNVTQNYSFTPTASDPDNDPLTFSVQNLPVWASFDAQNGSISGTPGTADEGDYPGIIISVSDGDLSSALPAFSITVETSNQPPTISGSPNLNVTVDETYSFVPTASDADGDTLTFSILNMPSWASFDAPTGALTGIPRTGDEGTYNNITISVSDGELSASLPSFSLTVNAIATGSVVLSWTPPTENEDDTLLTDLTSYRFYWGNSSGSYSGEIQVDDPGISSYTLENLTPGTYYVVATLMNSRGQESDYSNEIVKVVTGE